MIATMPHVRLYTSCLTLSDSAILPFIILVTVIGQNRKPVRGLHPSPYQVHSSTSATPDHVAIGSVFAALPLAVPSCKPLLLLARPAPTTTYSFRTLTSEAVE